MHPLLELIVLREYWEIVREYSRLGKINLIGVLGNEIASAFIGLLWYRDLRSLNKQHWSFGDHSLRLPAVFFLFTTIACPARF